MSHSLSIVALGVVLLTPALSGQGLRLSGGLAPALAEVGNSETRFSRSGASVVFLVRQGGTDELHAAPRDGGEAPVRLHPSLVGSAQRVLDFLPCSGERVVFRADLDTPGLHELYLAPIDGSVAPVLLSGTPRGRVTQFTLTPDGTKVVFLCERSAGVAEPFVVTLDAGLGPIPLDPAGNDWSFFQLTPDGSQLYLVRPTAFTQGLFRVPLDASQLPTQVAKSDSFLAPCPFYGGRFGPLALSTDGQHAAYIEVTECSPPAFCLQQFTRVFGVEQATGSVTLLDQAECALQTVLISGARVLILSQNGLLRSVKTDGTGVVTLASSVLGLELTPDGSQIVLLRGSGAARVLEVAPVDGSTPALQLATGAIEEPLRITADSNLVVYVETFASGFRALKAVSVDAVGPLLLNAPEVPARGVRTFGLALLGASFGSITSLALAPDGVNALVLAGRRLLRVPVDGSAAPAELGPTLIPAGAVSTFAATGDGAEVVLLADAEVDGRLELYSQPLDGSLPAVKLSGALVAGGSVLDFALAGARVVYRADQTLDDVPELYSVPLTGGTPLRLTVLSAGARVEPEYRVSASGLAVHYRLFQSRLSLYRVPVDGSATPLRLHSAPRSGSIGVSAFEPSADGQRITLLADLRVPQLVELFSVPESGGALTTLAQVSSGVRVLSFRNSPGGEAFFKTEDGLHRPLGLFRVPLDGRRAPSLVHAPVALGLGAENDYVPLRSGVVFRGDLEADGRFELFRSDPRGPATTGNAARPTVTRTILR